MKRFLFFITGSDANAFHLFSCCVEFVPVGLRDIGLRGNKWFLKKKRVAAVFEWTREKKITLSKSDTEERIPAGAPSPDQTGCNRIRDVPECCRTMRMKLKAVGQT